MAEIILPPIPPRPAPAVRPTMTPTLETPGNKGVKVIMIQGPGTEPGPQPEPAEPLAVADGKGANWVGTNVYEIGQVVEGRTAEYVGGVEPVSFRYRFQTKATGSDSWVNQSWTNTTNSKNPVYFEITEAGQLKLQSQARDSSEPTVQLNSITGIKTIQPQTTIGDIAFLVNGVEAVGSNCSALVGSTINVDCVTSGGTATNETYSWRIRSGDANITGSTTNKTCDVQLGSQYPGSVQVQCTVSSQNSSNSPQSGVLMVVLAESMKVADPEAY
jgi:hypothetical protein